MFEIKCIFKTVVFAAVITFLVTALFYVIICLSRTNNSVLYREWNMVSQIPYMEEDEELAYFAVDEEDKVNNEEWEEESRIVDFSVEFRKDGTFKNSIGIEGHYCLNENILTITYFDDSCGWAADVCEVLILTKDKLALRLTYTSDDQQRHNTMLEFD